MFCLASQQKPPFKITLREGRQHLFVCSHADPGVPPSKIIALRFYISSLTPLTPAVIPSSLNWKQAALKSAKLTSQHILFRPELTVVLSNVWKLYIRTPKSRHVCMRTFVCAVSCTNIHTSFLIWSQLFLRGENGSCF